MAKFYLILASSMLAVLLSGCGSIGNLYTYKGNGVLYTHKVEPLTHHYTPIQVAQADKNSSGDETELQFRYVTVLWGENAIGEVAKKAGFQTIHYADIERRSILFGIWSRNIVRIYGTVKAETVQVTKKVSKVHRSEMGLTYLYSGFFYAHFNP